jgi:hypothetical protein
MSAPPRNDITPPAKGAIDSLRGDLTRLELFGGSLGRFLSNLRYLGWTLGVYGGLSLGTYAWLAIQFGTVKGKAITIAYDVATGGNPLAYTGEVKPSFPGLWIWISVFHVLAWVAIPVLVATTVDATYRLYEQARIRAERRLRRRIRNHGRKKYGLSGIELDDFVDKTIETIDNLRRTLD